MKKIKIIIERTEDMFWAYAEKEEKITGGGATVKECKQDILDCIETLKEFDDLNRPEFIDSEFELVYQYDIESLLSNYKKIISFSALERLTGIHQKQLNHYATGYRKPRKDKVKKIEDALHKLGNEFLSVQLS